jgi:transposase
MTDPDARIMKQPDGGFAPSYNVQLNTDSANGLIVAVGVTQAGSDINQLTSGIERIEENFGAMPKQMVADGGYVSRENIIAMEFKNVDFIAPQCDEAGKAKSNYDTRGISKEYGKSQFVYDDYDNSYQCPQGKTLGLHSIDRNGFKVTHVYGADIADCSGCIAKGQCCPTSTKSGRTIQHIEELPPVIRFREKMETEDAKEIYRQRAQIAETPNLWIKAKFKLRQFSVRGLKKAGIESLWVCLTYNICQWIRLCWRKQRANANAAA